MDTCPGARRSKQKQQHQTIEETQLHYPHQHHQQQLHPQLHQQPHPQQQQQQHHHHHHHLHSMQQLPEQQQFHQQQQHFHTQQQQQQHQQQQQQQQQQQHHHHQKQPQQIQHQSKHHHTKPISAEKYGLSIVMHSGSISRQNNCSPTPQQAFPHFPPPPDYPPPTMASAATKQTSSSGALVTPLGVATMTTLCPGGSADSGNSSSGGGGGGHIPSRRVAHRYPEDLDSIEVCAEQEPITGKSFRSKNAGSNGSLDGSNIGGGGVDSGGSSRSSGSHGKIMMEPQTKWSRSNISATMEKFSHSPTTPCPPMPMQQTHQDYSYAYYEPGAAMRHSNIPPPEQVAGPSRPPPPNSIRALLSKGKKNKLLVSPSTRQSYQTRYGTQENFYEEIAGEERSAMMMAAGHSLASINQSMVEEEFRRVQNRHRKILGELNLSVEAMLMPETPPSSSPTEEEATDKSADNLTELLNTVGPTDELLSPVSSSNPAFCGDLDSGFSGSSGASYIGSLRYHKTNAALSNIMTTRKSIKSGGASGTHSSGTHSKSGSSGNSTGGASGAVMNSNASPFYGSSCRSSSRSHEESTDHSGAFFGRTTGGRSIAVSSYTKVKSAEDPGPSIATESKARSFWNRKGWRKLPVFSSTSSVHQAGTDEPKLNSGSWEDPLPIASPLTQSTQITTAQLHNTSRRSDPLNTRSSFNGIHNQLIIPQHQSKSFSNSGSAESGLAGQQTGSHKRLEHTPSARTINSSEDSWCSEREHDLSSDDDDVSERSVTSTTQRNSQLRSTFNKAKQHLSFDKWRTSGSGGGNSGNQQQQTQQQQPSQQQTPTQSVGSVNSATMPAATAAHHQQQQHQESTTPGESPGGRLSRWFSIRRGSTHQYDIGGRDGRHSSSSGSLDTTDNTEHSSPKSIGNSGNVGNTAGTKMPQLTENEDDTTRTLDLDLLMPPGSRANGTARPHSRLITPTLPPAPAGLSQQQLKRRHIVAAIVHSENSYVATLQRLVNDYKKPLEESSPPVLSSSKISTLFHRLPDILQCHKLFRIELADCVRNWDRDEKIGDVFVAAFSKPQILEVYSGFINNFSAAMELAKMEAKRKSALADFLKVKQISAHDRLSFFGLMVKPVQRFPQFILFLQDLLKYTPQGHHDRMSLQLALTQLESLAEMLNERKREAEQYQAFKEMLGHISGTFNTRSLSSSSEGGRQRYLLREDNVTQMEFNQSGFIIKSKQRRLLLLNDKVICVSVAPKQSHDFGATEKLSFKWMYPVTDVEIVDNSTSATLSRILTAGVNRGGSLKSNSSSCGNNDSATALTNGADNLCSEMSNLMHDYEVISRISDLVGSLKGHYKELNVDVTRNLLNSIQSSIQKKDEEMAWVDSCCLQLIARNKSGKEETFTFQTENPSVKKEWITELRLAQLALDVNNSPAWEVPEHDQRPSTKMPLFVKAQPVYKSQHQTEVRCGCYYSITNDNKLGTARRRFKTQNYIWVCTSDGTSSHVAVLSQHQQQSGVLKDVGSFDLSETQVTSMEFVKGLTNNTTKDEQSNLLGDLVWMGTDNKKILIYSATNPEQEEQITHCSVPAVVLQILYYYDSVFVVLSNSNLLIYRRAYDGIWMLKDPQVIQLSNSCSISSILPINNNIYAGCGHRVYVFSASSGEMQKSFEIQHGSAQQVNLMAHSGIGLWVSLKNSSIICLYHTETFKHLQDINIASNVLRVKSSPKESVNNNSVHVTALIACKGLLWVGTNIGIALTIPLPRLEGVPIISGGVSISCHAHFGAITFLLPLVPKNFMSYKPAIVEQPISNSVSEETPAQTAKENSKKDGNDDSVMLRKDLDDSLNSSGQESPKRNLDKQNSLDLSLASKLRAQLANSPALRRKRYREMSELSRMSKTLPRGLGSANFFSQSMNSNPMSLQHNDHGYCDVYGLYGKLIFVKEDYDSEEGAQGNLMDLMYESMRRSDPELAAIPGKVSTLDRRLRMKASRPRSLDLSNWSVDSRSSSLYTSSGSEESMGIRLFGGRSVSRNSSSASHKTSANGSDLGNISENGTITVDVHSTPLNHDSNKYLSSMNASNNQALEKVTANKEQLLSSTMPANIITRITPPSMVSTIAAATLKKKSKGAGGKNASNVNDQGPRTLITLMGGRGYWRHVWYNSPSSKTTTSPSTLSRVANSNDAHIVIWEKKL